MFNYGIPRVCQYISALTGSLNIISSEMHFGWPSSALTPLTNGSYYFQISPKEASWLAVMLFPGVVVGALIANLLSRSFGRKMIILLSTVPLFVSWVLLGLGRSKVLFYIGRFLGGIGGGLSFSAVPMYVGEISEPNIRGFLSSLCPVFVVLGMFFINLLGLYLPIDTSALIACGLPVFTFIAFFFMPESPVFLMSKGEHEQAKKNLSLLRGSENGYKEFQRLQDVFQNTEKQEEINVFDAFKVKKNRKALLIGLGLRSVQQFCGSTAIIFYCSSLFEETSTFASPNVGSIIFFSLQAIVAMFSSCIVDSIGRRPLFLVSLIGTTLTLFVLGLYLFLQNCTGIDLDQYSYTSPVALFLNVIFFSLGIRNIPLLVISELFDAKFKPTAVCIATIYYALLAIVMTQFFRITKEQIDVSFPFFVFGVLSFVSAVLFFLFVPETKGKTLEEIQSILEK